MKRKGRSKGIIKRLIPQVHVEPIKAAQMVARILSEIIKQPPRFRTETETVAFDGMW
jgi:hypothetical protein